MYPTRYFGAAYICSFCILHDITPRYSIVITNNNDSTSFVHAIAQIVRRSRSRETKIGIVLRSYEDSLRSHIELKKTDGYLNHRVFDAGEITVRTWARCFRFLIIPSLESRQCIASYAYHVWILIELMESQFPDQAPIIVQVVVNDKNHIDLSRLGMWVCRDFLR